MDKNKQFFLKKNIFLKHFFLVILIFLILLWQLQFYLNPKKIDNSYTRPNTAGLRAIFLKHFLYFYYYLGLYPLVPYITPIEYTEEGKINQKITEPNLVLPIEYSKEGALNLLKNHGEIIHMDLENVILWGDNVKTLMFFPDVIIRGTAINPSVKTFNALFFIFSLVLLSISFYYIKKPLLGIILILLLGSNPYQLYEVYGNENLFGVHISTLMILLAINLPFLLPKEKIKPRHLSLIAISGIIMGTMAHIRMEILTLLASCFLIYFFIPKTNIKNKILCCLIFLASFSLTEQMWVKYFDYKFTQAQKVVESIGGNPFLYPELRKNHHTIWHSILLGFSDFDTKYGYKWDDMTAYEYAAPILNQRGVSLPEDKEVWSVLPEYQQIMKEKAINQIKNDPVWYFNIIKNRINALFEKTVPIGININYYFPKVMIPKIFLILSVIILIIFLIVSKKFILLKILLFSFPISMVTILIQASNNTTNMSVFHIFTFAIYIYIFILLTAKKFLNLKNGS